MTLARLFLCTALLGAAAAAHALDVQPYTPQALAQAQQAGKPVALHFHADWCPTCRAQDKALQTLAAEPGLDLTVLQANYDQEKDLKRTHRVNTQSTLVVFKGAKETGRLAGDASTDGLRKVLKTAL